MAGSPSAGCSRLAVPAGGSSVNIDVTLYPTDHFGTPTAYNLSATIASTGTYQPTIAVSGGRLTPQGITISSGTWIASTRTLRKTNAFVGYGFVAGDKVWVDAGVPGYYDIESKTDDSNIVLRVPVWQANISGINGQIDNVACITLSGAFANYFYRSGDDISLTSGTGLVQTGLVPIAAKISADQIRLGPGAAYGTVASDLAASIPAQFVVTKTSAFANYNWRSGDVFTVSSGTGLVAADYVIVEKLSSDSIRLATDAGAAASDLVGLVPTQTVRANASIMRDAGEVTIHRLYSTTPAAADEFNVVDNAGNAIQGLSFKGLGPFDLGPHGVSVPGNIGLRVHSVTAISGANTPCIVMLYKHTR